MTNDEIRTTKEIPNPNFESEASAATVSIRSFELRHLPEPPHLSCYGSMNDLKFALRQLLKNPGFNALALLSLALGIGANTALFSVVYGVLISPYPYSRPGEIWTPGLRSATANQRMRPYRLREYLEMSRLSSFADVMATARTACF